MLQLPTLLLVGAEGVDSIVFRFTFRISIVT